MKRSMIVVAIVAALVLSACGSDKKGTSSTTVKGTGSGATVAVAASLQQAVTALIQVYDKANPSLQMAPPVVQDPTALAASVAGSTPGVDILLDASITKVGAGATKATFGRDVGVIAVPTANPHHVTGLTAFAASSGLHTTVCGARFSLGNLPFLVLLKAKIKPAANAVTFDCSKVMNDLVTGKLDAALLFRSGLTPPQGVKLLTVPAAQDVPVGYSIVLVGKDPRVVAFGKFVASAAGQAVLKLEGLLP